MNNFFSFIDGIADFFSSFLTYAIQFFSLIGKSFTYLLDVMALLPPYFYIGIAPFVTLFFALFILDRG